MRDVQQTDIRFTASIPVERVHGALLGAAIGDALGWPQESNSGRQGHASEPSDVLTFQAWRRKGGSRFEAYAQDIQAGEYSDDTQLLIATARSILRGSHWVMALSKQEIPLWLLYERGGGGATKRAARAWLSGGTPWKQPEKQQKSYFGAGGNGVAMRVLPHVLRYGQTREQLLRDVMRNGILTHGHPRALLGAMVYARAGWWITHTATPLPREGVLQELLDHRTEWEMLPGNTESSTAEWLDAANHAFSHNYEAEWQKTVQEICQGLLLIQRAIREQGALLNDQAILERLGCFGKMSGSGVVAALAVLYLFSVYVTDPLTGLRTIAFAKSADTDTLASMLGGLFGLTYGLEWLPMSLQHVQDRDLIGDIAHRLARPIPKGEGETITRWSEQDAQQVITGLQAQQNTPIALGTLGNATVQAHRTLTPLTRNLSEADEWCLRTDAGQTVYITNVQRAPAPTPAKTHAASASSKKQAIPVSPRPDHGLSAETVETTLQVLRKVLNAAPDDPGVLQNIVTGQWNNLTDTDCQMVISRLEQFLQVVHDPTGNGS